MVNVDDAVVARLKKGGAVFEILVDCDNAILLKSGKSISLADVVAVEHVFSDAKRGEKSPTHLINQVFATDDFDKIAVTIIKEGEVQTTKEHRNKELIQKHNEIVNYIHRYGVDPRTHLPIPVERVENAFEAAKVRVDSRDVQAQLQDVIRKLRVVLPIKFETKEIEVVIPASYAPRSYKILRTFGTVKEEKWTDSGAMRAVVEMPGGLEADFYESVGNLTHGEATMKVLTIK